MSLHPVLVKLPKRLYTRVEKRAQQSQRSVESELLAVATQAIDADDELPRDISTMLDELSFLDDKALWRTARRIFKTGEAAQLEKLQLKRQKDGLSESELQRLLELLRQYEKHMLIRAQAAAILKQRGHDISNLLVAV